MLTPAERIRRLDAAVDAIRQGMTQDELYEVLRVLAALLGHSNLKLNTAMIYTAPRTEDMVDRLEQMEFCG